ncbi:hypothetical protein BLS_002497 [Venturia inaequalis]|uniref:Uncharacterized protein n=1 Tax=Venturia inaequalis TaxID=5025 RepID=A0A8H3YIV6_VENIN|nr:hypothetical protein BLS_002497 [Venturia inaequalis]KAE9969349.1 hypothetical protein EG328_006939 [Venturia inaequalis]KAE9990236.1 hypothetical protein EG327_001663 [Venturia inaequalis]
MVQTLRPQLWASEIIAYNDEELDRHIERYGRTIDVQDPEVLMQNKPFIQRLKDRANNTTDSVKSSPVDAQQLTARLLQGPTYKERAIRSPSVTSTTPPFTEEEEYLEDKRYETESFKWLVDSGGRPSHPLERMEDIVKTPGKDSEILSYWLDEADQDNDWRGLFQQQAGRWKCFRRIQCYAREQQFGHERVLMIAETFNNWEEFVGRCGPLQGGMGFPEYAKAAKERLQRHGFTRIFQLDLDLSQQDKLTTWIEYLNYEYLRYEDFSTKVRRGHRHDNKAWKKLVDSVALRPEETKEFLCSVDCGWQQAAERERAEEHMKAVRRVVVSVEQVIATPRQSRVSSQALQQRLLAAQLKLRGAEEEFWRIKGRNDCVSEYILSTKNYRIAKENAERHPILLRWMLQQIPLIELELNPPQKNSHTEELVGKISFSENQEAVLGRGPQTKERDRCGSETRPRSDQLSRKGKKRCRDDIEDDEDGTISPKRARNGGWPQFASWQPMNSTWFHDGQGSSQPARQPGSRPRHGETQRIDEPGTLSGHPRRSARIAMRREANLAATTSKKSPINRDKLSRSKRRFEDRRSKQTV